MGWVVLIHKQMNDDGSGEEFYFNLRLGTLAESHQFLHICCGEILQPLEPQVTVATFQ